MVAAFTLGLVGRSSGAPLTVKEFRSQAKVICQAYSRTSSAQPGSSPTSSGNQHVTPLLFSRLFTRTVLDPLRTEYQALMRLSPPAQVSKTSTEVLRYESQDVEAFSRIATEIKTGRVTFGDSLVLVVVDLRKNAPRETALWRKLDITACPG